MEKRVLVYFLDDHDDIQFELFTFKDQVKSRLFKDFEISTKDLFN